MNRENSICASCQEEDMIFRQGESILLQLQLLREDDTPINDLDDYSVVILVIGPRSAEIAYGHNAGPGFLPIETDAEGNMALFVSSEQTVSMLGGYSLEIAIGKDHSKIITSAPGFEIVPSQVMKYMNQE